MSYSIYSNSAPYGNVVLSGSSGSGIYQITGQTTFANPTYSSGSAGVLTVNGGGTNSMGWTNTPGIKVKGDADFEGNVIINGQNLAKTLETINQRLAILVPDPKLLEKYEALQQAYQHYKTLEALCVETSNSDK